MLTAILLDGGKNPINIRIRKEEMTASISWGGSATNPAKHFNFVKTIKRDEGSPDEQAVAIYKRAGLKADALIIGLREKDLHTGLSDSPVTVERHGDLLADQFLYPEKYAEMGQSAAA